MELETLISELSTSIIEDDDASPISVTLHDNADLVKTQGWSILTSLSERIADTKLNERGKKSFQTVLNYTIENGNLKEILFSLLEVCQAFTSTSSFILVLPCLAKTVLLLPLQQLSLDIILETVSSHIKGIPRNDDYCLMVEDLDGVETLMTNDESKDTVAELVFCIDKIIVELATPVWQGFSTDYSQAQRDMFVDFLLQFLNYPLLYLHSDKSVSACCLTILKLLQQLVPTLSTLLEHYMHQQTSSFTIEQLRQEPVNDALANTTVPPGIGHLCYLTFCENLVVDYFPYVYRSEHRVSLLLPYLNELYRQSANSVVIYKVQGLMCSLLKVIPDNSFDEEMTSIPSLRSFIPYCYWCMQYCELSPLRKTASRLLKEFINKFSLKCKFIIYNWILETEKNPEVLGYTYTQIKDVIHLTWQDDRRQTGELQKYGVRLITQIYKAPDLKNPNRKGVSLMDDLGKIASALNLALYLVLRDKRRSSPYTTDMARYIREYIKPVGSVLKLETDRLNARLTALLAEPTSSTTEHAPPVCSFTVGSETITHNNQLEREATEAAIAKLDLVSYNHTMLKNALET